MLIQWFPGHMAKTKKLIAENLKAADVVAELLDARIPLSSSNPLIAQITAGKPRFIILNKADMADPSMTEKWIRWYRTRGIRATALDGRNVRGRKKMLALTRDMAAPILAKWHRKGLRNRTVRMMILGIPNVGKSTLINSMAGTAAARTANTPGHTRGKQWVHLAEGIELLDTPGVLWPKFEDQTAAVRLAATGAISDDVYDAELVVNVLLRELAQRAPEGLRERYGIGDPDAEPEEMLDMIARRRGCVLSGGRIDLERTRKIVLNDFRSKKLGLVTLDPVPEEEEYDDQ